MKTNNNGLLLVAFFGVISYLSLTSQPDAAPPKPEAQVCCNGDCCKCADRLAELENVLAAEMVASNAVEETYKAAQDRMVKDFVELKNQLEELKEQLKKPDPPETTLTVPKESFAEYVARNYRGEEWVEPNSDDASVSHLVSVHGWPREELEGLTRSQRRKIHGASHTGRVEALRRQYEGGTTKVATRQPQGRWVTRKICRNGRCYLERVWVSY